MTYAKFIILGQARTGSSFLSLLLDSHPNIKIYGELFHPWEKERKENSIGIKTLGLQENPIEYLNRFIFNDYSESISAVGFKIFYDHARNATWRPVWEYLKKSNVKVIHLKRKNLLDRYLSLELALKSNVWMVFGENGEALNCTLTLDPKKCFKDFSDSVAFQNKADNFFAGNQKLDVVYEDLAKNLARESIRLQNFLGLEIRELSARSFKQQTRKKPEIVTNYNELKEEMIQRIAKGSAKEEWIEFFDDPVPLPESDLERITKESQRRTPASWEIVRTPVGSELKVRENRFGSFEMEIKEIQLLDSDRTPVKELRTGDSLDIQIEYLAHKPIDGPIFGVTISDDKRLEYYVINTALSGSTLPTVEGKGRLDLHIDRLDLNSGKYYVDIGVYEQNWSYAYDFHWQVYPIYVRSPHNNKGIISPPHSWRVQPVSV